MDIIEQQVREFAERFPTPNVQRMLTLCESGAITWMQAHDLAKRALLRGMSCPSAVRVAHIGGVRCPVSRPNHLPESELKQEDAMTSYSTHGVGRIRLVDGDLSPDEETREEQFEQIVDCLAAGVCRALLDQARDLSDDDADVYAEQWHSADQDWELDALDDDARSAVQELVRRFATENLADVLTLAEFIAWGAYTGSEVWHGDSGMGMYRVGYLLGMEGAGQGVGFRDYADRTSGTQTPADRLSAWLDEQDGGYPFEGAYVDGTQEPCLLHLS